ncbi:oligosaccharide repeat unit polymerase [Verrucomicrobia bacterium]|nr:oligosaccharide repeat unit polymerase [Verrucomicrobiota bacterium]
MRKKILLWITAISEFFLIVYGIIVYGSQFGMLTSGTELSFENTFVALIFISITCLSINIFNKRPSDYAIALLIFFWFIPLVSYYGMTGVGLKFVLAANTGLITIYYSRYFLRGLNLDSKQNTIQIAHFALIFVGGFSLIFIIGLNGLPTLTAIDLTRVYEVRRAYSSSSVMEYLQSWTIFVVSPFIIASGIFEKSYKKVLFGLSINMFIFLGSGGKYSLFVTVFCLVFIFLINYDFEISIGLFLISVLLFAYSMVYITGNIEYIHLLFIRPIWVPGWLSIIWFQFFNEGHLLFLAEVFPRLIEHPYGYGSTILIGDLLFADKGGSWATGNWVADAFANFGFIGPVIFGLLIGLVFGFADALHRKRNHIGFLVAFLTTVNHLIFSATLTVFASRGLLFSLLIGYLVCCSKTNETKKLGLQNLDHTGRRTYS